MNLFDDQSGLASDSLALDPAKQRELGQWFTPAWAAEVLFDAHFGSLSATDLVWEPACGDGRQLAAVPAHVPAIGTELDPALAARAHARTGREVIVGDCRTVPLPAGITSVYGNPPFELKVFEELMDRCASILRNGDRAGFVLPAYFIQTSRTVMQWARVWSISQEVLPRDLFPGLSKPLVFGLFTRDFTPRLVGFRLFSEMAEFRELPDARQEEFASKLSGPRSVWRESVAGVLRELGGTASLEAIYRAIEGRRPTGTTWWKEQVRKVLQQHFARVGEGRYTFAGAAAS